jgi:hypothetical protein
LTLPVSISMNRRSSIVLHSDRVGMELKRLALGDFPSDCAHLDGSGEAVRKLHYDGVGSL